MLPDSNARKYLLVANSIECSFAFMRAGFVKMLQNQQHAGDCKTWW